MKFLLMMLLSDRNETAFKVSNQFIHLIKSAPSLHIHDT